MTLQQEILFERLVPRYERAFGAEPSVDGLPLDEAVKVIRARLEMQAEEGRRLTAHYGSGG